MHAFSTTAELYGVLENLFKEVNEESGLIHDFAHSNLVVRIRLSDPAGEVLLDGRQPPVGIFYGSAPGEANFEIELEADLLHRIWMDEESLMSALFSGDIRTTGNLMRAQPFINLFQSCGQLYQRIVSDSGL